MVRSLTLGAMVFVNMKEISCLIYYFVLDLNESFLPHLKFGLEGREKLSILIKISN